MHMCVCVCVERQRGFPTCIHSEKSLHQNKRDYGVSRVVCLLCLFTQLMGAAQDRQ